MSSPRIQVNRAPVLTLWAAVVAERPGYDPGAALAFLANRRAATTLATTMD